MLFNETSFAQKQKANQEHITPAELRRFIADNLPLTPISVFDGAIGSGQMLQFMNVKKIMGVDVNIDSLDACKFNFQTAELINDCFFNAMSQFSENQFDLCVSNYPFSLKIKDLPEQSQRKILNDDLLNRFFDKNKLTGVCDFLFILKMFQFSKRYSIFFAFPGIAYRNAEKKYRDCLTPYVREIGIIENCNFATTTISVLFLLLDKQHTGDTKTFRLDLKTNKKTERLTTLNANNWELPAFENETPKMTEADFINCEIEARRSILKRLEHALKVSKMYEEIGTAGFPPSLDFIKDLKKIISKFQ